MGTSSYQETQQHQETMVQYSTLLHYQTRNVISHGSGIGDALYHGQGGCVHQNHMRGNGSQTATNTIANRQFNGRCCVQWKNSAKTHQSNGYAIPLAARQRMSEAVQNILETRQIKLRRLLDEASSSNTPQGSEERVHRPEHGFVDATN